MDWYNTILALIISSFVYSRTNALRSENIIGGNRAIKGQFPYQANIFCNGKDVCGGTLIDPGFVLTTAHGLIGRDCDFSMKKIKVVTGITRLYDRSDSRVEMGVQNYFLHPHYNEKKLWDFDIAVIQLDGRINFTMHPHIGVARLPMDDYSWDGHQGRIAGFGWDWVSVKRDYYTNKPVEKGGNDRTFLKYVRVEIFSNSECRHLHPANVNLKSQQLCGRTIQTRWDKIEGACDGDSGSGLVVNDTVVGILCTTPIGCDDRDSGSIYVRVSEFASFIYLAMHNEDYQPISIDSDNNIEQSSSSDWDSD